MQINLTTQTAKFKDLAARGVAVDKAVKGARQPEPTRDSGFVIEFIRVGPEATVGSLAKRYAELFERLRERYGSNQYELYKQLGELNQAFETALQSIQSSATQDLNHFFEAFIVNIQSNDFETAFADSHVNHEANILSEAEFQRQTREFLLKIALETAEIKRQWAEMNAEEAERWLRILMIAARIASGGNVPPEDREFLLANSPGMYMLATSMQAEGADDDIATSVSLLCKQVLD